jgi:hypothetical protein
VEQIGRQILGDALGRIPVTLLLAAEPDLAELAAGLQFPGHAGWVVSGRCGLGTLSLDGAPPEGAAPSLPELVSRLLRNPLATGLTIACTPDELAEASVPVDRFSRIIACRTALDPAWREVLAARTEAWLDVPDPAAALHEASSA